MARKDSAPFPTQDSCAVSLVQSRDAPLINRSSTCSYRSLARWADASNDTICGTSRTGGYRRHDYHWIDRFQSRIFSLLKTEHSGPKGAGFRTKVHTLPWIHRSRLLVLEQLMPFLGCPCHTFVFRESETQLAGASRQDICLCCTGSFLCPLQSE